MSRVPDTVMPGMISAATFFNTTVYFLRVAFFFYPYVFINDLPESIAYRQVFGNGAAGNT
ncbi:MAG TPA: hypothetical protein PKL77_03250 [Candidatus Omnitrophota bacterium]|nr:hypothetical protein [Candidatus Omnitrophota bacterium]